MKTDILGTGMLLDCLCGSTLLPECDPHRAGPVCPLEPPCVVPNLSFPLQRPGIWGQSGANRQSKCAVMEKKLLVPSVP